MKSCKLFTLLFVLVLVALASGNKCCNSCPSGQAKYYSIDKLFNRCGECCMNPGDFWKFKIFEPGMHKANVNNPCAQKGYTKYENTETHGFMKLKMTLDKYRK